VLTFGSSIGAVILGSVSYNGVWAASVAALAALVIVGAVGVVVHRPLARVPENQLKLTVGIMLTSFGTFWAGEGLGVDWPGTDLSIVALLVVFALAAWGAIELMKRAPEGVAAQ
jgi:Ca2+/H+ antiporter, TMEM165/GDT1 family